MKTVEKNKNKSGVKNLTYNDIEKIYPSETGSESYFYRYRLEQYTARLISDINEQSLNVVAKKLLQLPDEDVEFLKDYLDLFDKKHPDRYKLLNRLVDIYEKKIVYKRYASLDELDINDPDLQKEVVKGFHNMMKFEEFNDDEKREILEKRLLLDKNALRKKVKNEEKKEILQNSFNLFKQLKNRDTILHYLFQEEWGQEPNIRYRENVIYSFYNIIDDDDKYFVYNVVSEKLLNKFYLMHFILDNPECFEKNVKYNKIMKDFFPDIKNNGR